MTSKELKRMLAAQGATFTQGKGSHLKVTLNGKKSVLPMHNGDLPLGTVNGILKQLGLKE
jgi:mRNA interferase HicA